MNLVGMLMMEKFFGSQKNGVPGSAGGSTEVESLKQEIAKLREERERDRDRQLMEERLRRQEEQNRELERRMLEQHRELVAKLEHKTQDKDLTLELMKLRESSTNKGEDTWLKFMMMNREDNKASQERLDALMAKMFDKPDGIDQSAKVLSLMMESSVSQLNMMTQIVQSGLLGGSSDHPMIDLLRDGVQSAQEALKEYFRSRAGGSISGLPAEVEEDEEYGEEEALPASVPPRRIEGRTDEGPEEPEEGDGEQEAEELETETLTEADIVGDPSKLKEILLTDEELASMKRDHAASMIFEAIRKGDLRQATARIYGQANSGKVAFQKWFVAPGPVSGQVLVKFHLAEYMLALPQDMVEYNEHLENGGDPNDWSPEYSPVKRKEGAKVVDEKPIPEFGVEVKEPKKGEVVDPSVPPPGVDPKVVEAQRKARQREAMLDRFHQVEENIGRLKAGKVTPRQAEVMRKEGLLPPAGDEDAALQEIQTLRAGLEDGGSDG